MDYQNGLLNGLPTWTTKMDYPKLPTFKKKEKISKAWLFIDRFPQVLRAISAILFYKCCWSAVLQAHSFVACAWTCAWMADTPGGGGGGGWYSSEFLVPNFRPKYSIFHTRFQTWPLKSIPVFRPLLYRN